MIVDYEKKPVGTILKNLRVENGFSLRALAKEFGIDHSNIYIWEKRNETPTQQMLEKYHKFFNVSYEYLLGETDEPTSTEIGKTRFETEEDYALKRLAEENPRCFNTLSYLLLSPYGQILLEELTDGLQKKDISELPADYQKLQALATKKRIYTQDEIRTFIKNKKGENK